MAKSVLSRPGVWKELARGETAVRRLLGELFLLLRCGATRDWAGGRGERAGKRWIHTVLMEERADNR